MLALGIAAPSLSAVQTEAATQSLFSDLRELRGLERVARALGEPSTIGSKGGSTAGFGEILIAIGSAGGLIPSLAQLLLGWMGRQKQPTKIRVKLGGNEVEIDAAMTTEEISATLDQASKILRKKE